MAGAAGRRSEPRWVAHKALAGADEMHTTNRPAKRGSREPCAVALRWATRTRRVLHEVHQRPRGVGGRET